MRIVRVNRIVLVKVRQYHVLPLKKSNIGIRNPIAHKPWSSSSVLMFRLRILPALPSQVPLKDSRNSMNLLDISLNSTKNLLRMKLLKPSQLSIVRTLARSLEQKPLLRQSVLIRAKRKAQLLLGIVSFNKVKQNGAGLP